MEKNLEKPVKKRKRSKNNSFDKGSREKPRIEKEAPIKQYNQLYKEPEKPHSSGAFKILDQLVITFEPQKIDSSKNRSYEEKGLVKVSTDLIIPEGLIFCFSGKNIEITKLIMSKTGSMITIQVTY